MLPKRIHRAITWLVLITMTLTAPTAHAGIGGMLSGGLNAARSVGGGMASRGMGMAQSVASRGTGVARSVATRGVGTAQTFTNRGIGVAHNVAQGGAGFVQNVAPRVTNIGGQVATRSVNVAGRAVNSARITGGAVVQQGMNVGNQLATRSVNVADRAVNTARLTGSAVAQQGAALGNQLATQSVNAAGRAVNSARLATSAAVQRATAPVPFPNGNLGINGGGMPQHSVLTNLNQGGVAAGLARFNNATQIVAAKPNLGASAAALAPNVIAANNLAPAINPANFLVAQQAKAAVANKLHNVGNAVAAIPPKAVNAAGQVAQAAGLPPLPGNVAQAVNDVAALPQAVVNFPVGAFVKSEVKQLKTNVANGQLVNNAAALGQQVVGGNNQAVNDALNIAGQVEKVIQNPNALVNVLLPPQGPQQPVPGGPVAPGGAPGNGAPANGAPNNPGGVLAADQIANDVLNIVNAAQPEFIPVPIPVGIGPIGGGGGVAAGGGSPVVQEIVEAPPADSAPAENTAIEPQSTAAAGDIDLALEDLQLAARATTIAGPAYRLRFRNQGTAAAGDFHILLMAGVDARPATDAPRAMAHVPGLAAGEVVDVTLRLPASATQMTGADGNRTAMTHVFVALDYADAVVELDESNNLAIVEAIALETAMR